MIIVKQKNLSVNKTTWVNEIQNFEAILVELRKSILFFNRLPIYSSEPAKLEVLLDLNISHNIMNLIDFPCFFHAFSISFGMKRHHKLATEIADTLPVF